MLVQMPEAPVSKTWTLDLFRMAVDNCLLNRSLGIEGREDNEEADRELHYVPVWLHQRIAEHHCALPLLIPSHIDHHKYIDNQRSQQHQQGAFQLITTTEYGSEKYSNKGTSWR